MQVLGDMVTIIQDNDVAAQLMTRERDKANKAKANAKEAYTIRHDMMASETDMSFETFAVAFRLDEATVQDESLVSAPRWGVNEKILILD
jgi:hypothetical protein